MGAVSNTNISNGGGLTSGSHGSDAAIGVVGANDFAWFRINSEAFLEGGFSWAMTASPVGVVNGSDNSGQKAGIGLKVIVTVDSITGAPNLVVKIQGKAPNGGAYFDMAATAAITAAGTTVLTMFPGAPSTANLFINDHLPFTWRLVRTITGTGTVTGDISAIVLV
jgi:hypothetical protein